jgi:hypothetical protein
MERDQERSGSEGEGARQPDSDRPAAGSGRSTELWLLGMGLSFFLSGAALVVLPTVSPGNGWVVRSLASRGVTSLPLYVSGVVLVGLWLATRANRMNAGSQPVVESEDSTVQTLTEEVAHLGDGLQGLRIEFVYLKDAIQTQAQHAPESSGTDASDAVYRMAASLDQLGLRVEERLLTNHREVGETLKGLSTALESVKAAAMAPRVVIDRDDSYDGANDEKIHAGSAHDEDHDSPHADEHNRARLGLLDMLDDLGRLLPRKVSVPLERPPMRIETFEGVQDEGWKQAGSVQAPLPSVRQGEELRLPGPANLLGSGSTPAEPAKDDPVLGDKLAELRSLLADQRVRDALASIERGLR